LKKENFKRTKLACYLGFVTQAIMANFAPLLFLKFHSDYDISLGNIALISTAFFFTQLLVDLFCAKFVDRIGYRVAIVASEICAAAGLTGLAFLPELFNNHFVGIMWPGTLSISSKKFPLGGTAMFALLAMAGDLGGSIGPAIVGRVAQNSGDNIRAGMGAGLIFPAVLIVMTVIIGKAGRKKSV